jgi:SHS2 domain-containing protein
MPYHYLEDETTVDVAFEAKAESFEALCREAWNATLGLMVENPDAVAAARRAEFELSNSSGEMLLFDLLGELLYRKDAEGALYRLQDLTVRQPAAGGAGDQVWRLTATIDGEELDPAKHHYGVDIKAVTLYAFTVEPREEGWFARVVLDT